MSEARKLADAGKLKEAAALCEGHLGHHGPSAEAYYLLGLVYDAENDQRAEEFYKKALYLEPGHQETLSHMALLMKKLGRDAESTTFKRRAERALKQS